MPIDPKATYNPQGVEPILPGEARTDAVMLNPNKTYPKGTVLSQVTVASANCVQTLNATGTVSGGTFTLSIEGVDGQTYTTAALAYNISNANLKIAVEALMEAAGYHGATVTVGGGALPTDATLTFGGTLANFPVPLIVCEDALITGGGTLVAEMTTTGKRQWIWDAYSDADASSLGLGVAKAINQYTVKTNNLGEVTFADAGIGDETGATYESAPAWFSGRFKTTDLVGLDANGVADLGRLESGTLADGVLALI